MKPRSWIDFLKQKRQQSVAWTTRPRQALSIQISQFLATHFPQDLSDFELSQSASGQSTCRTCRYQNKPDRLDMVRHGSRCFPKSSRIRKRLFWTDFKPVVATCRICRLDGGVAHLSLGVRCAVGWGGAYNIRIHSLNLFVHICSRTCCACVCYSI